MELENNTQTTTKSKESKQKQQTPKTKKTKEKKELKEPKKHPPIKGYITTNKTTTSNNKPSPNPPTTTTGPKKQTTTTKPNPKQEENKKTRLKPPNIDQITPVQLPIKVRGTVVTDLKGFLARKKLERDSRQAKMHNSAQNSNNEARGNLQTKSPKEKNV